MKVSELIAALQALPQDYEAVILDADTDWCLKIIEVRASHSTIRPDMVVIGGCYSFQAYDRYDA